MTAVDEPGAYEIRIHGCLSVQEALGLKEPVKRVLCPDPDHAPPCDVPWSCFALGDDERADDGIEATVLVLGVHASGRRAAQVADQVRGVVGETRPVTVSAAAAGQFQELAEQYRIERAVRQS
ncbi:hypothetical protein [Streptomyces violaceus]|uniref:DUF3168 domain-containing protein n=1 Tax=Streptomyces violaceus TaxID=1936 RepID=A0ABY9U016_STRVL|nr:hypothetical protein [Streptomyces janthinus]WND15913.1 hypothetical protein RI060_00365 [Streptomyces janthinus]GGS98643.1 hypothetical protein GCM10010270_83300 [Streptomyces janthinus]